MADGCVGHHGEGAESGTDRERQPPRGPPQPPGREHSQARQDDRQDDELHAVRQRCSKEKRPVNAGILTRGLGDHERPDQGKHIAATDHEQYCEREILEGQQVDPGAAEEKPIAGIQTPSTCDPER